MKIRAIKFKQCTSFDRARSQRKIPLRIKQKVDTKKVRKRKRERGFRPKESANQAEENEGREREKTGTKEDRESKKQKEREKRHRSEGMRRKLLAIADSRGRVSYELSLGLIPQSRAEWEERLLSSVCSAIEAAETIETG